MGVLNPMIKTPNLDRLAKSGIIYRQATCQSPSCVPSRNSMMFGFYPSQLGVLSNGSHSIGDDFIPCDPLPARLKKAGYQTAGFGKTHWGRTEHSKNTRGFEYRVVGAKEVGMEEGAILYQDDENPQGLAAYRKETHSFGPGEEGVPGYVGATSQVADRDHRDGYVAEKCLDFLDKSTDPVRPLFLYLSFLKPHAGLNVPKRFEDLYDLSGSVVPENRRGTIDERPAELVDLYPTMVKVAGIKQELDSPGLDLLGNQKHIGSFSEYHDSHSPAYMWRNAKWKLILFMDRPLSEAKLSPDSAKGELYDLEADPHEWKNVYADPKYASQSGSR